MYGDWTAAVPNGGCLQHHIGIRSAGRDGKDAGLPATGDWEPVAINNQATKGGS